MPETPDPDILCLASAVELALGGQDEQQCNVAINDGYWSAQQLQMPSADAAAATGCSRAGQHLGWLLL